MPIKMKKGQNYCNECDKKKLCHSCFPDKIWGALLLKIVESFYKGIDFDETYIENYLEVADIYLNHSDNLKRFDLAYGILKKCFNHMYRHYSWLEKDDSFTSRPFDLLSLACYYSGRKKESLLYAFIAREKNKSDERLTKNIDVILQSISDKDLINENSYI